MDLYKEILIKALEKEDVHISFPNLKIEPIAIVKLECYKALQEIKAIIEDKSLDDGDCFMRIEQIVCLFEGLGSDGGDRHDFT